MTNSTRPSLAFSLVEGVFIIVHGKDPPLDTEWDKLVNATVQNYLRTGYTCALALSKGGTPTTAQRHRFDVFVRNEIMPKYGLPRGRMAVLSDSGFTRAVVTASAMMSQNWFARTIRGSDAPQMYRAFSTSELSPALTWLEISSSKHSIIARELDRLRNDVG